MTKIEQIFTAIGGQFIIKPPQIVERLSQIKAFVFDWDGVFNDGTKSESGSSMFSEVDSMGVNLLRFSSWNRSTMPIMAVISGEKNEQSFKLVEREHYDACYFKIKHKIEALEHLMAAHNLQKHEVAFFFDDALDLSIAEVCGLRLMMRHGGNPLFEQYVIKNDLVDYITGNMGGQHAVREASELLMGLAGNFDQTIDLRRAYYPHYEQYLYERQKITPQFFTSENGVIKTVLHRQS